MTLEEIRASIDSERPLLVSQKERITVSLYLKIQCQLALNHRDDSEQILFWEKLHSDSALRLVTFLVEQAVRIRQFVETLAPDASTVDEIIQRRRH